MNKANTTRYEIKSRHSNKDVCWVYKT